MRLFDVLGPVMIGPSSSHTAGAAKIGYTAQKLLGEVPAQADIGLYGSFATTGKGHGTDRALVAGLLGLRPDDPRLPDSFALAAQRGMQFSIHPVELRSAHPNTAVLTLTSRTGRQLSLKAASVGGGRIRVTEIDGVPADFGGDSNTLIIHNEDTPGCIAEVTMALALRRINIASMQVFRAAAGGVDARGNGSSLRPGDCLAGSESFSARAVHDAAGVHSADAGFIPAARFDVGKHSGLIGLRFLKGTQPVRCQRGNGQQQAE